MNPVKSVTDTLRSNFYSTVLAVASLGALSGCGGEEEIKPTEPKIENINGQLSEDNNGVNKSLGFGTTNIETVLSVSFRVKDDATGDVYVVQSHKVNPGNENATMTLSEVDVVTEKSTLYLGYDNTVVGAIPTKQIVGTIDFKPNHGSNEINLDYRLYGLKKVQFTANEVDIYESDKEAKLEYLSKNKEVFKEVMHGLMQSVNDNRPYEPGEQRMPLFVTVSKLN